MPEAHGSTRLTADATGIGLANAARLVGVYTRPGGLVVDLYGTGLFAAAAARSGRRATTVVTDSAHRDATQDAAESVVDPARRSQVRTVVASSPGTAVDLLAAASARIQLLITRLPHHDEEMTLRAAGRWMTACRYALTPHGYLIAAINPTQDGAYVDHATTIITAARAAGLIYHQHLLGLAGPLPQLDGEQPLPPRLPAGGRHERVHTDLLVLANGASHA